MGFEYHQPGMDIKKKELALNYACAFIRPIDSQLEDIIIEVASSNKIRLNVQKVIHFQPLTIAYRVKKC
jgi:hypothetical protein